MSIVKIENLKLRTIIGTYDYERIEKQNVIVQLSFEYDSSNPEQNDELVGAVDYKALVDKIDAKVSSSKFFLLEKLCRFILDIVLEEKAIMRAKIRVSKPDALRFADSVSVELNYPENISNEL